MKNQVSRFRHKLILSAGRHPALFFGMLRVQQRLGQSRGLAIITPDTEIVIEGFLRSANSFATRAFLSAQPRRVRVANRTHVPATIIRAAQWNVPALVLIREPKDVVLSYILKKPFISAEDGYKDYIAYYRDIAPYRAHYVVASFDEVTTDFGEVIDRLNQRFGTHFERFDHTAENQRDVFSLIERNDRRLVGDDVGRISVPLPEKERVKDDHRREIETADLRTLIAEAEDLYRTFVTASATKMDHTAQQSIGAVS
jgi:hypothetical protein